MSEHDVISDVLRSLRLEGTLYFEVRVTAPWGFSIPASDHAVFHFVTQGTAWLSTEEQEWVRVESGQTVVFPHGTAHALSHEPGGRGIDGRTMFERVDDDGVVRLHGSAGGSGATIICGHFSYDQTLPHPLVKSLPSVVLAVDRSQDLAPGARALTDRLAEVLLIEVLADLSERDSRFVRSLRDPTVAAALHALHESPDVDWTVASLCSHVGVSRATLATRFSELVGESPIRYLTRWRMHLAARYLRKTTLSAAEVGMRVGYGSPFSFSKAFSRELGMAPSHYRSSRGVGVSPVPTAPGSAPGDGEAL